MVEYRVVSVSGIIEGRVSEHVEVQGYVDSIHRKYNWYFNSGPSSSSYEGRLTDRRNTLSFEDDIFHNSSREIVRTLEIVCDAKIKVNLQGRLVGKKLMVRRIATKNENNT